MVPDPRDLSATFDAVARDDAIGFVWDAREAAWEEGFAALMIFKAREGHCYVPVSYKEGTFKLGAWVNRQRTQRNTMSAERKRLLDATGFIWVAR